jgi:hypothetical protein
MRRLFLAIGLLLALTAPVAADYDSGKTAYAKGDYATALREWRPLANGGDPLAQFALGTLYEKGRGVKQSGAEAVKWYTLSANQNFAEAQLKLAYLYAGGTVVKQNDAEAAKWMKAAAGNSHVMGQLGLGALYEYGRGVPRDLKEAFRFYDQVARATPPGEVHDEAEKARERVGAKLNKPMTVDPAIVGKWEARLPEPKSDVVARFTMTIAEDGGYALRELRMAKNGASLPSPDDSRGQLEAREGRYVITGANGVLKGAYRIIDSATFEMATDTGRTIRWKRIRT